MWGQPPSAVQPTRRVGSPATNAETIGPCGRRAAEGSATENSTQSTLTQPTYNSTSTIATTAAGIPTIAIVGRPNVGKSTLFNRIVGSRRAIVGDEPGITRDRLYGDAEWENRHLRIVDTGGILPEEKDLIPSEIYRQARVALDEAAAIIMVVDGRTELAGPDLELARLLRKANRPLFLAVNKVDSEKQSNLIDDFHRLGLPKMFPISAEHGRGVDDLLDAVIAAIPQDENSESATSERSSRDAPKPPRPRSRKHLEHSEPSDTDLDTEGPTTDDQGSTTDFETKVAIIGHPNVGKSTLLNSLTASDRAIVSPIPGTTRDAVDEIVEHNGRRFRFIDTAGIRRKGKTHLMAEKLSVVMARKHLEAADIALLVIDATEGVSQLDASIAGLAHESGRSLIIVVNKWDLMISGKEKTARPTKSERMRESKRPGDREAYEDTPARPPEVPELRAHRLHFRPERQRHRKDFPAPRKSRHRTPQARHHEPDEPLHRKSRLRTRLRPHEVARKNSLHDAGLGRPAHLRPLHQPRRKTALLLPALPRKPNPRSLRLRRHPDLDQERARNS